MSHRHSKGEAAAPPNDPPRSHHSKGHAKSDRADGATVFSKSSTHSFPTALASTIYADGPDFEFDLDTVSSTLWDERFMKDLFHGVDVRQLTDHSNLCRSVFSGCVTEFGRKIHFKELIHYMTSRNMLTGDEVYQLTDKPVSKSEKAIYLTINVLPLKGEVLTPISLFYSCLVESASNEDGLEGHYYLAQRLRESVHEIIHRQCGILSNTRERQIRETDVIQVIGKTCRKFPDANSTTILALIHQLKLSSCSPPVTAEHNVAWIFECWRRLYRECDWTNVVEALVLVPKLGYLVSNLLTPCRSSPPQICRFVHSLEDDWPLLADHLGYPRRLVQAIQNHWGGSYHSQIKAFLKYWVFPDCGITSNNRIVERLKTYLGKDAETPQPRQEATFDDYIPSTTASRQAVHKPIDVETDLAFVQSSECGRPPQVFSGQSEGKQNVLSPEEHLSEDEPEPPVKSKFSAPHLPEPEPHPPEPEPHPPEPQHSQEPKSAKLSMPHPLKLEPHSPEVPEGKPPPSSGMTGLREAPTQEMVERGEALLTAIRGGNRYAINELMQLPFSTECKGDDGRTPFLHFCARYGMQEPLKLAISAGSTIDATDADNNCCFHYQVVLKHPSVLKMLLLEFDLRELKYPVNIVNKQGMSPLMVACRMGVSCLDSIQLLLAHGADPNGPDKSCVQARTPPLIVASKDNCLEIVELLLAYSANINIRDKTYKTTALIQACTWGHTGVVQLLLEIGATISLQEMDGTTALTAAVRKNAVGVIKFLIKSFANVNQRSFTGSYGGSEETPLAITCAENFREAAAVLIEAGARTDYRCSNRVPPIGFAIIRGHLGMVRFMLKHTKPEYKTVYTLSDAFDVAMAFEKYDAATLLVEDAGGLDFALGEARNAGVTNLICRLEEYGGYVQADFIHPDKMMANVSDTISVEDEKRKAEEILQQFCYICMKAVTNAYDCDTLATFAEGGGRSGAAGFFRTYSVCPMSPRDLKSGLVRGDRESALNFLIEQKALDVVTFLTVATQVYTQTEELDDFYRKLAFAVQTIPGSESIPVDRTDVILEKLLNGDLLLVEEGPSGEGGSGFHSSATGGADAALDSGFHSNVNNASGGASGYASSKDTEPHSLSESSGYRNQSPFEVVDAEKTMMNRRVDHHGTTGHVPPPAPTSTGAGSLFQRLKIERYDGNLKKGYKLGDGSTGGNRTAVPGTSSPAMPTRAATHEPASVTPAPEIKKSQSDSDSANEPTNKQPPLPDATPSRKKALTKQQEMDSSDRTMSASFASHLDSSHQETHPPPTSTPGHQAVRKLSPAATPLQQSAAQPSTPHTHPQRHTSEPTPGSTRSDSETRDEVLNSCPPRIATENSQVAVPPSTGGSEPPRGSHSHRHTATAPEAMPVRVLAMSGGHSTGASAPVLGTVAEAGKKLEVMSTVESSKLSGRPSADDSASIETTYTVATTPFRTTATQSSAQSSHALATGMESSRAHGTPTQDRKTSAHEVQYPVKETSGADQESVRFTVGGETSSLNSTVSPHHHASPSASNSNRDVPPTSRKVPTTLPPMSDLSDKATSVTLRNPPDNLAGVADVSILSNSRKKVSTTATESPADHELAVSPDRHQIQRQEGHESKDKADSAEETPQPSSLLSLQSGQGQYSREVSRDSLDSLENQKTFRLKPSLHLGKSTTLSITGPYFKRLQNEGYRRAEVTVDLGRELENVGTYWFLLPGQTTIQAIERALDEACLKGYKKACLNFKFQRLPDSELSSSMETPTIADWERLNPVSCTSNLRLVELRVLNACRSGLKNVTYYYGIGGSDQEFEEELCEDSVSDFLTLFVDTCCSGDRYSAELRFVFSE